MATKKAVKKEVGPSPEAQVFAASYDWFEKLDKLQKHIAKRNFDSLKAEAAWSTKYNELQQETSKAGRALFALHKSLKTKKKKKVA